MSAIQTNTAGRWHLVGRIILAAVLGDVALILLTTIAQEVLFNGIRYYTSPLFDLIFGGLATILAAILAGLLASYIVKGSTLIPHWIISFLVLVETTWLLASGALSGPLWFEIPSGLSLVLGILIGHSAYRGFLAGN